MWTFFIRWLKSLDKVEKLKKEANMEVWKTAVDSRSDAIHTMLIHQFLKDYKTCLHFSTHFYKSSNRIMDWQVSCYDVNRY